MLATQDAVRYIEQRFLSVHLSRLEPKALRLSAENFLLLLLPLLLMAVVAFAKSQRADFDVPVSYTHLTLPTIYSV